MRDGSLTFALPIRHGTLDVQLHRPHATNDECPILQEPIATAVMDAFPRPFLLDKPEHSAITLQCHHTFHAMALIYHWARNRTVLCPICRNGPCGQRLILSKLPREWRYSMAARVRKEQRLDRIETEQSNLQAAVNIQNTSTVRILQSRMLELYIRIEAEPGASPPNWSLKTRLMPLGDTVLCIVPASELRAIPYGQDTLIRMVPHTNVHTLQPSDRFRGSIDIANEFVMRRDEEGFQHIHYTISEELFAIMLMDIHLQSDSIVQIFMVTP